MAGAVAAKGAAEKAAEGLTLRVLRFVSGWRVYQSSGNVCRWRAFGPKMKSPLAIFIYVIEPACARGLSFR